MKIQFNTAQLSRPQLESLLKILDVLQAENKNEIEVTPVEFPLKLMVKLDDDIEMLLGWDAEKESYAGLTTPEPKPEPKPESKPEPKPEPHIAYVPTPKEVAVLAYDLMKIYLLFTLEQQMEFNKEYALLLKESK